MNKQTSFLGGSTPPIPTCPLSRKSIFSTNFYNNSNTCFVHTFPMELEYAIYYLLPDPFCYVLSTLFLYEEYAEPCLII